MAYPTGGGPPRWQADVLVACDGPWRHDDPILGTWDLAALSPGGALLARDRIITVFGARADRRLRETWSRP